MRKITGTYARIKDGYEQWYRMVYLSLSIPPFHDGQIVYIEASYPDRGYSVCDGGVSAMIPFEYLEDIDAIH